MFETGLLRGKRVLITGGGTGLGLSMGKRFLELGALLSICGRREEVLKQAAAELEQNAPGGESGRVAWQRCDIRDAAAVDAMLDALWTEGPLDALVNNAAGNFIAKTEELSPRAIDAVLGIVLHGSAYVTVACGRRWLAEKRRASVLSIVTSYAWTGSAYVVPSAMAKAGVLAMTRSLAVEWGGQGVRLNAIAPGRHEELANLAAFLLSDGAGYINGEVVTIDGGEWLQGAGQFNFLKELTDADWDEVRKKKGK